MAKTNKKFKKKTSRPEFTGYFPYPNKLARSGKLVSKAAKVTFGAIFAYDPARPSYNTIVKDTGYSRPKVAEAIQELKTLNIISYTKGNSFKKANQYKMIHPDKWKLVNNIYQSSKTTKTSKEKNRTGKKSEPNLVKKMNSNKTNTRRPRKKRTKKNNNSKKSDFFELNTEETQLFQEFKILFKKNTSRAYSSNGLKEVELFSHSISKLERSVEDIRIVMNNYFQNPYYNTYSVKGMLSAFEWLIDWKPSAKELQEFYSKKGLNLSADVIDKPLSQNTLYQGRLHKVKEGVAKLKEAKYVEVLQEIRRHKVNHEVKKYIEKLEENLN